MATTLMRRRESHLLRLGARRVGLGAARCVVGTTAHVAEARRLDGGHCDGGVDVLQKQVIKYVFCDGSLLVKGFFGIEKRRQGMCICFI